MKIFPVAKIADIDAYTIKEEPINSLNLMERASEVFTDKLIELLSANRVHQSYFEIVVGPGNNGGDALAVARFLSYMARGVRIWLLYPPEKMSTDAVANLKRLNNCSTDECFVKQVSEIECYNDEAIIIDGLFGSGLNRPLTGKVKEAVMHINSFSNTVVSIDVPSGLRGEDNSENDYSAVINADYTISFQFPKLCFLLAENEQYVGDWSVVDIGLHPKIIEESASDYYFTQLDDIHLKTRRRFSHKGDYGHALLMAGSYGMMGAAVLASKACLKSGVGLLTTHVPRLGYNIIQTAVPEAICSIDRSDILVSEYPDLSAYSAIGVGPGIGVKPNTKIAIEEVLKNTTNQRLVVDADAINLMAAHPYLIDLLPSDAVLTPHPGEFDRLAGSSASGYERLQKAILFAKERDVIVVLKGAYTAVINTDGRCWFNSTGNAGMATGGSGDVLTGILLSFLAQEYNTFEAARLAVFVHGLSADNFVSDGSAEALTASDMINGVNRAFKWIMDHQ